MNRSATKPGVWEGIVKVQLPLSGGTEALVYPESREWMLVLDDQTWPAKDRMMQGRSKVFFHARRSNEGLEILEEAPWQSW